MFRTCLTIAAAAALLTACARNNETAAPQTASSQTASPQTQAAPGAVPTEAQAQPSADAKALLSTLPAPYASGDIENGRRVFMRCQVCHSVAEGAPNLIGPNLWGVFGRKVASKADYDYSDALKSKTWTWDAQHIDTWISDPRRVAPGTKMSFAGIPDPKDRVDLIAYLKTVTSK